MNIYLRGMSWIVIITLFILIASLFSVWDGGSNGQAISWEAAYGVQYPYIEDYSELASRGINLVVNNVHTDPQEWERYYQAVIAHNLMIIPVLWDIEQTAWKWNAENSEWELDINKYPTSTGAQFLQFLRDNPIYLSHTFAVYSFHEPYNPESNAQVSSSQMKKFWQQIHDEEFSAVNLKIYGESISWKRECANGCVDYDALGLYNFAYCGLGGRYQYRPYNITSDPDGLSIWFGPCTTDKKAVIAADKRAIDAYYEFIQSTPPAPDGSRTQLFALIQTFAKDNPSADIVNRMPDAWELYEWGTQIVNAKKDKLAGMQWYVFRFGELYDFKLGDNRYDTECADRWKAIKDVANVLLGDVQPLPTRTPLPPDLFWEAEDGIILPPFVMEGEYIYQPIYTGDDLEASGKATYQFTIDKPGDYFVKAFIDAVDVNSNSIYLNIDGEPDLTMVWDVEVTVGFEERYVPRGSSSEPRVFTLTGGEHDLILRGRDANTKIDRISLEAKLLQPPTSASDCSNFLPLIISSELTICKCLSNEVAPNRWQP